MKLLHGSWVQTISECHSYNNHTYVQSSSAWSTQHADLITSWLLWIRRTCFSTHCSRFDVTGVATGVNTLSDFPCPRSTSTTVPHWMLFRQESFTDVANVGPACTLGITLILSGPVSCLTRGTRGSAVESRWSGCLPGDRNTLLCSAVSISQSSSSGTTTLLSVSSCDKRISTSAPLVRKRSMASSYLRFNKLWPSIAISWSPENEWMNDGI